MKLHPQLECEGIDLVFDARLKVIELLRWIKEQGLWPEKADNESLWVVPIANRIEKYRNLQPHQRDMALWLPSQDELSRLLETRGYEGFEFDEKDGIHFVQLGKKPPKAHGGVGVGPTEAILSALQAMRNEAA